MTHPMIKYFGKAKIKLRFATRVGPTLLFLQGCFRLSAYFLCTNFNWCIKIGA